MSQLPVFATAQELIDCGKIDSNAVKVFDRKDILGYSVRACKKFEAGQIICSIGGKVYSTSSVFAAMSTSLYRVHVEDEWELDGHPSYEETKNHVGSFINDANGLIKFPNISNNTILLLHPLLVADNQKWAIFVKASRVIEAGEELWLDYGANYWRFITEEKIIGQPFITSLRGTARKTVKRSTSVDVDEKNIKKKMKT